MGEARGSSDGGPRRHICRLSCFASLLEGRGGRLLFFYKSHLHSYSSAANCSNRIKPRCIVDTLGSGNGTSGNLVYRSR